MLSSNVALVIYHKLDFTVWTAEFQVLRFLSQILIRGLQKSFLGICRAVDWANYLHAQFNTVLWLGITVERASHPSAHLNTVPAG